MTRIEKFRIEEHPEWAAMANAIRQKVFVEEQSVDPEIEYDEYEQDAWHYLLFEDAVPVATARWRKTANGVKLERFATLSEYRDRGLGGILLKRVLEDVKPLKVKTYLHSQLKAVSLYARQGFEKEGEMFEEAEIKHFMMVLKR